MLARRLQTLLSARERAALFRLYFAGCHAQPNLKSLRCKTSETITSTIKTKTPLTTCTTRQWFGGKVRNDRIITRACSTLTDDDAIEPERYSENSYARTVLVSSKHNLKSLGHPLEATENVTDEEAKSILDQDWKSASADETLEAFRKLSCNAKVKPQQLDDERHKNILTSLAAKLKEMSDDQLCMIYQCCLVWEDVAWSRCVGYTELCQAMNAECTERLTGWTQEEALLMCDYLFQLRLCRRYQYPWLVLKKLGKRPNRMSPGHLLHFMFLLNVCRKPPINMYEVEYRFDKILDEYTADELGVIAMGFFKSQTSVRDQKIVSRIQVKVLEAIDTIHDISFSAIMKITRYSTGLKDLNLMENILEAVKPRVPELTIPSLVHLIHAAAFVQLHNAELMQMVIERFMTDIDSARLKDLERFAWALSIYNYDAKLPIYEKIVESLRDPKREAEIERFAPILTTTMMHLSNVGIFPMDLIKKVFDPKFLHRVYNNNAYKIGWDFFALESNLKTEMPDYEGPFLSDNVRRFLAKKYLTDLMATKPSKVHPSDKMILEVAHMCKLALGSETAIHIDHILPHFIKPDIIISLDEKNEPVAPGPILSKIAQGTIKQPPPEAGDLRWIAIVLATQNQMIRRTDQYIGALITKLRQLRKLGYHPIVVTHIQWRSLPNLEAKQNYLRSILPPSAARNKVSAEAV